MDTEQGAFTPVTEAEVMSFARRMATSLVGYSKQAEELIAIKTELDGLRLKLQNVEADNAKLNADIHSATELASQAEKERDLAKAESSTWQSKATHLQDLMIGRDATVSELRQKLVKVETDYAESSRRVALLEGETASLTKDRDGWLNAHHAMEDKASKLEADLAKATSDLAAIRSAHEKVFAAFGGQSAPGPTVGSVQSTTAETLPSSPTAPTQSAEKPTPVSSEPWQPSVEMPKVVDEGGKPLPSTTDPNVPEWLKPKKAEDIQF